MSTKKIPLDAILKLFATPGAAIPLEADNVYEWTDEDRRNFDKVLANLP